jgi:hypothetical protein
MDFRSCRFEQCDVSLRSAIPMSNTAPQPSPFTFGGNTNNTNGAIPAFPNTLTLKFVAATLVLSEALTKREARWMPDLARSPTRRDLPYFPGVSLVRSFDRNLSFSIPWNMFSMSFNKRTYWLYPRRVRLLFRTLLMIRKYRDQTGLGRLDMNVMRMIFDLIATPRPLWLPLPDQETMVVETQKQFVLMQAEEPSDEPRFTFGTANPFGTKPGFTFGGGSGVAPGLGAAQSSHFFGGQPAVQQGGGFNFGGAQPAQPAAAFGFGANANHAAGFGATANNVGGFGVPVAKKTTAITNAQIKKEVAEEHSDPTSDGGGDE